MFLNMVPVWVVVLAAVLLWQPITTPVAVGIPTVILGLLVFQQNPLALFHRFIAARTGKARADPAAGRGSSRPGAGRRGCTAERQA